MQVPDLSPTAIEVEYSLVIKAWPVKEIPGDNGGLKIRFDDDRTIVESAVSITIPGKDSEAGRKAVGEILSVLLKNIGDIQSVGESNIEEICKSQEFINQEIR